MVPTDKYRAVFVILTALVCLCTLTLLNRPEHGQHLAHNALDVSADITILPKAAGEHAQNEVLSNAPKVPSLHTRAPPIQRPTISNTQAQAAFTLSLQAATTEYDDHILVQGGHMVAGFTLASPFHDPADLPKNGWTCQPDTRVQDFSPRNRVPLESFLQSLGLNTEITHDDFPENPPPGRNHPIMCVHDRPYNANGHRCEPTGATYTFILNPTQGLLIVHGPQHPPQTPIGRKPITATEPLPEPFLAYWDEIVALTIRHLAQDEWSSRDNQRGLRPKLRYIIRTNVHGAGMTDLVQEVLDSVGQTRMAMQGQQQKGKAPERMELAGGKSLVLAVGEAEEDGRQAGRREFRAMVGSPLGDLAARLLDCHKELFGITRMKSVTLFFDDAEQDAKLGVLFQIETWREGSRIWV